MNTQADSTHPDHAQKIAAILSIQPDGSQGLSQFSAEQRAAYEWAIQWLHDFNLDRQPKPNFPDEVLGRLSDFHGVQMSERLRQRATLPRLEEEPASHGLSPEIEAFIDQMVHNLNTHQPGVPRGQNVGNCQQPEFSPDSVATPAGSEPLDE